MAHYGLYPDWVEDPRRIAGNRIVKDLARGSEAYLQMWERTDGVAPERCRSPRGRVTRRGLGRHRLRMTPRQLLRRAGQPIVYGVRRGRVRYVAVAARTAARNRGRLRAYIRLAGLR